MVVINKTAKTADSSCKLVSSSILFAVADIDTTSRRQLSVAIIHVYGGLQFAFSAM